MGVRATLVSMCNGDWLTLDDDWTTRLGILAIIGSVLRLGNSPNVGLVIVKTVIRNDFIREAAVRPSV